MVAIQALDQEPALLRLLAHRALAPFRQAQIAGVQVARPCFHLRRRSRDRGGRGVGSLFPTGLRCSGGSGSDGGSARDREAASKAVPSAANIQNHRRVPLSKRHTFRKTGDHGNHSSRQAQCCQTMSGMACFLGFSGQVLSLQRKTCPRILLLSRRRWYRYPAWR